MLDNKKIEGFIINLKRRPDRLSIFFKNCPIKNLSIIFGFDGKNIDLEDKDEIKLISKFEGFKPGEIGCFLSHLRIWKIIVENKIKHSIIFEDDAIFTDNFLNKFNSVLYNLNDDMDILYIGGRFNPNFKMKPKNYLQISDNIIQHNKNNLDLNEDGFIFCRTTHSYIISYDLAKLFISIFENESKITIALDHWMMNNILKNKIKVYDSFPLLCHSPYISDSDIR
jgi:glycosyl transferase family 25